MAKLLNFFALQGSLVSPEVVHIPLDSSVQSDLSGRFEEMAAELAPAGCKRIAYTGTYHPTPGEEVCEIATFGIPAQILDAAKSPTSLATLTESDIAGGSIRAIVALEPTRTNLRFKRLLFQVADSRNVIQKGRGFFLDKSVFRIVSHASFVFSSKVDAIFDDTDSLVFLSDAKVRRILDLSPHFRAATDAEVKKFLTGKAFHVASLSGATANTDQWARKKIASILREDVIKSAGGVAKVVSIAKTKIQFDIETFVDVQGNLRIVIPADKAGFKELLRILDQDILESPFTSELYDVNSKQKRL